MTAQVSAGLKLARSLGMALLLLPGFIRSPKRIVEWRGLSQEYPPVAPTAISGEPGVLRAIPLPAAIGEFPKEVPRW